jgi:hypothetical protein
MAESAGILADIDQDVAQYLEACLPVIGILRQHFPMGVLWRADSGCHGRPHRNISSPAQFKKIEAGDLDRWARWGYILSKSPKIKADYNALACLPPEHPRKIKKVDSRSSILNPLPDSCPAFDE